jgi:hypothetical protein
MKFPQADKQSKSSSLPPPASLTGWAKSSAGPLVRGITNKSAQGSKPKHSDAMVADLEEQSVASEEIDALEFSMGGADSDSNGSFSFLNDDSIASHKSKAGLKPVSRVAPRKPLSANQSTESADVDFSVTETDLSTSGHGLFETDYDYTTSALPPVKTKGAKGKSGW